MAHEKSTFLDYAPFFSQNFKLLEHNQTFKKSPPMNLHLDGAFLFTESHLSRHSQNSSLYAMESVVVQREKRTNQNKSL